MKITLSFLAVLTLFASSFSSFAAEGSKEKVFFISPKNHAQVTSPVHIKMGVHGMTVKKAGEAGEKTGHHHIVVDAGPIPAGQPVPKDATHIHFGKGEIETDLALTPGKHKLTLQFADAMHMSYGEAMSQTIEITVK